MQAPAHGTWGLPAACCSSRVHLHAHSGRGARDSHRGASHLFLVLLFSLSVPQRLRRVLALLQLHVLPAGTWSSAAESQPVPYFPSERNLAHCRDCPEAAAAVANPAFESALTLCPKRDPSVPFPVPQSTTLLQLIFSCTPPKRLHFSACSKQAGQGGWCASGEGQHSGCTALT